MKTQSDRFFDACIQNLTAERIAALQAGQEQRMREIQRDVVQRVQQSSLDQQRAATYYADARYKG